MPAYLYICENCGNGAIERRPAEDKDLGTYCKKCGDIALRAEFKSNKNGGEYLEIKDENDRS